jgi:hypothetical protein
MPGSASKLLLGSLLLFACASSRAKPAAHVPGSTAVQRGSDALVDDDWGVGLLVDPVTTRSDVTPEHFAVETLSRGKIDEGVFSFSATLAADRARAGSATLAAAAREDWQKDAASELSGVTAVTFLGRPGHAFTFRQDDTFGLQIIAVHGKCVLDLVVLRSGRPEWMTDYASLVIRNLKSLTGKPLDPAVCR